MILAGCHPVMMEYFTPQGKRKPYPACMREVEGCDVVVAIVAHRYGWVPSRDEQGDGHETVRHGIPHTMRVIWRSVAPTASFESRQT